MKRKYGKAEKVYPIGIATPYFAGVKDKISYRRFLGTGHSRWAYFFNSPTETEDKNIVFDCNTIFADTHFITQFRNDSGKE